MDRYKSLLTIPKSSHEVFNQWTGTRKLVFAALLGVFAAMLQAAGGILPGVGLMLSPFSTLMILLATIISLQHGIFTYLLTILLLVLIEPSELFIFSFATGLLGLGMGWGLVRLTGVLAIVLLNGLCLFIGICIPAFIFTFPILGPMTPVLIGFKYLPVIFVFSVFYSWLWLEISLYLIKKINKILNLEK